MFRRLNIGSNVAVRGQVLHSILFVLPLPYLLELVCLNGQTLRGFLFVKKLLKDLVLLKKDETRAKLNYSFVRLSFFIRSFLRLLTRSF